MHNVRREVIASAARLGIFELTSHERTKPDLDAHSVSFFLMSSISVDDVICRTFYRLVGITAGLRGSNLTFSMGFAQKVGR